MPGYENMKSVGGMEVKLCSIVFLFTTCIKGMHAILFSEFPVILRGLGNESDR
jgi:hypothetical protein